MNIDLDIDEYGDTMSTLRNKDIFNNLIKEIGIDAVMEKYHDQYISYTKKVMFDPRNSNVVYRTEEQAKMASEYIKQIEKLDAEYTEKQ